MTQLTESLSAARSVLMSCLQQAEAPHEAVKYERFFKEIDGARDERTKILEVKRF